jgi:glycosyltransferase involved in cell wall biosynthesis
MSRLLEDPDTARTMGENGYLRFTENYTLDAVVPRIVDAYEKLI